MQNYYCPLCATVFAMARAPKNGVPVCSKPGCVKKKQRYIASGEWEALLDEVNHGPTDKPVGLKVVAPNKSTSHVVALKEKVKERILAKKGLHDLLSSVPDDVGPQTPEEAVEAVQMVRGKVQELVTEGIVPQKTADAAVLLVSNGFRQCPVEDSTAINQQAKSVLAKVPVKKLDLNSDAATLARLNAAQKKPSKKGGES